MPGQFLRLRFLHSAGSLGFISDAYRVRASGCCSYRTISGLSTVPKPFPFHLKASCLPARICFDSNVPAVISRQFSGVSRDRGGRSGSFSSGRTGNFGRGRELASGGLYGAARKGKSLIEDEAELSDWVSDLRTDRFPKLSDSDSGDEMTFSSGRKTRGEAPGARNQRKERDLGRGKRRDSSFGTRDVDWEGEATGFRGSGSRSNNVSGEEIVGFGKRKASGFSMAGAPRTNFDSQEDFGDFRKRKETSFQGRKITGMNIDSDEEIGDFRTKKTLSFRWENTPTTVNQSDETGRFGGRDSGRLVKKKFEHQKRAMKIVEEEGEEDEDDDEDSGFESDFLSGSDGEEQSGNYLGNDKASGKPKGKAGELPKRSSQGKDSYLSESRFEDATLSPLSIKGVKAAGYEKMTVVQEATLPVILRGKDVLAKAKTGTGKTVAFLLPAIEAIVKLPPVGRDEKRPPIYVLIVCPTRELANQAAAEATKLLKFHPAIGVQFVIGGTRLPLEQKRMQANPCQILVATPGRLRDHIENTPGFATRLLGVKVLVLDEADHLLDMGFRKDIEKIIEAVPKQRQTLLFSATVPDEVRQMCHIALRRDHEFINTVEEGMQETHSQVKQTHLVAPLERHFSILYSLLKEHIADDPDYKVLVFCTTAMVTKLMSAFLSELNLNIREIHSRKPQSYRTRVSDEFRKSKGLILVTSDVSARGVDYPDVTLVVQVGLPSDREQYIHRLGRTGRKGKEGQGILLLAPWEDFFLSSIRDLPMSKAELPPTDPDMKKKVERALAHVEMKNKEAAYQAWLGYYNSVKTLSRDKVRLVELANEFSCSMGLDKPPAIPKLILGKMGLKNVPGLRSK